VPVDADVLAAHVADHGPYLFHVTEAEHQVSIMRDGLRQGSELARYVRDDFFRTRPGHVYICDRRSVAVVPERLTLRVDLRRLDPACFDTDEDVPYIQQRFQGQKWFDSKPPERRMLDDNETEAPGQAGRLVAWAESIEELDAPEFAARSLAGGRVAYRGTIPPEAVEVVELTSEVVEAFVKRACELLEMEDVGPVPTLAFNEVEASRALAIAQQVLDARMEALGRPPLSTDTDLSHPMSAYHLEDDIRRFGYERNHVGEWERRDLAFSLADLAQAVYELDAALGWNPEACVSIALNAASCLPHIASADGDESAAKLARAAVAGAA